MQELLVTLTEAVVPAIDLIALACIVAGSLQAVLLSARAALTGRGAVSRAVWLRYARWLVAGLTFQLAADILETAIAPSWDDVGRLAAVAAIRTFLDYFLERDLGEVAGRQGGAGEKPG